jgi:hypothetical protein
MPDLSTPRSRLDKDSQRAVGITPFTTLTSSDTEDNKPGMSMTTTTTTATTASDGEVTVSWSERKTNSEMLDPNSSVSGQ